ncbi:rRNA maturation RNase YbeY [Anaerococcus degeneri]|uniref:Endoribonuclease YbeY n=1 Tax=Anaerococcus degeneri TaxID=361500 RepID=A0ABS7YW62_9FIRM|nr:rRNA maturation RNase YbeY [Anaerococcus degeneri]MBP2015616.1 putative rRNA maturation factor [Anaerococcus degeneri]MCA2095977.1 rRNA maturation RNase YbeY [Anaerococcus degeneri]
MNLLIANDTNEDLDLDLIRKKAEKTITEVLRVENISENAEVSLSIVDRQTIHKLNKDYRNVDRETDVLSFPLDEEGFDMEGNPLILLGDIVICLDVAEGQAADFGHSLEREIMYLICHSTLHLLGYDHIEEDDKKVMRSKEKEVMKNLGVFK